MRFFIIFFFIISSIYGFSSISFNTRCKQAYGEMVKLEFDKSAKLLEREESINPNNIIPSFIKNYAAFLKILVEEDSKNYDSFIEDTKLIVENFEREPNKSPYKKYCITDLYLQMAYINALQESYFAAALKLRSARNSILENEEDFPDFLPNKKALGMMNVALGSVPENYGWILDLFGLEGSVNKGISMLKSLLNKVRITKEYDWLFTESVLSYTFSTINFGDAVKKDDLLESVFKDLTRTSTLFTNQLLSYSAASYYRHLGDNDSVISILSKRKQEKSTQKMYYLDFILGSAYLYKIDPAAIKYLTRYLIEFKGNTYRKSTLQRIAWYNLVTGNQKVYKQYMTRVSNEGNTFFDGDKQAQKEAESKEIPNKYLLKFRLLFDGGYYKEAVRIFKINTPARVLKTKKDFLEYNYRLGRLYDEWGKPEKAMEYYGKAIKDGKDFPYYFAANAALHLGYIYEKQRKLKQAELNYQLILELDFDEYHNSITQKAKAGLNRIEKLKK